MRRLVRHVPHAKLLIVGEGPDRRAYERLIAKYRLEDSVRLAGWQQHTEPFLRAADVLVLSSNYEGWGMAVVEALRAGLPVVMTDVGLAGEVVRDGIEGKIVPIGDAEAFFAACLALANPAARKAFADAAQRAGEALSKRSDGYLARYEAALRLCLPSV
jgi:glycosyltransferase involved in cell wall biosynthesis